MKVPSLLAVSGFAGLAIGSDALGQTFSYRAVQDTGRQCVEPTEVSPTVPFIAFTMTASSADSEGMGALKSLMPPSGASVSVVNFFNEAVASASPLLIGDSVLSIFVDEMTTSSFLRESGAFGGAVDADKTSYGPMRNFLISQHPQHFVEIHEHATPSTLSDILTQSASLAESVEAKIYVISDRKPEKLEWVPASATVTEFQAVTAGHLELPSERPAVVLLDMASLNGAKGEFVLDYMRQTLHNHSRRLGLFTSTVPEELPEVTEAAAKPRLLQAAPQPLKEIRVQPFQIAVVLTLGFAGLMLIMMTCCINSIDTPTQFEDKTLEITKEY